MAQEHPTRRPSFWRAVVRLWRFDLRRFRALIAVVVALELLRATFIEWFLHLAPLATDGRFGGEFGHQELEMPAAALWLATAIGTALLIQADHPADDRAFWRTRPISAWQLGIAKLTLFAVVFVAVPAFANALRLASYGAPPTAFVAATVQIAVTAGWIVVPCSALAIATRTLPRFLISVGGGLAACVMLVWAVVPHLPLFAQVAIAAHYSGLTAVALDWQRVELHGWLGALVATAVGLAILAVHYRHRRLPATGAALLALIAAPIAIPSRADIQPAAPELTARVADGIRLEVPELSLPRATAASKDLLALAGRLALLTLPPDVTGSLELQDVQLRSSGDGVSPSFATACCNDAFAAATLTAATGASVPPRPPGLNRAVVFNLTPAEAERVRDRTVDLDASVRVRFTRHHLVGELPLRAGVAFRTPEYLIEVLRVDLVRRTALCRLVRFPTLTIPPTPHLSLFVGNRSTRVEPSLSWWQLEPGRAEGAGRDDGRGWARRVSLPLVDNAADQVGARLLIVESTPVGGIETRLVGRNVAVTTRPYDARNDPGQRGRLE